MAISEEALSGILGGLKLAQERRATALHGALSRQKMQQEHEEEMARREQLASFHEDTLKYQGEILKLQQQINKIQGMKEIQNILGSGKPLPPGMTKIPGGEGSTQDVVRMEGMPSSNNQIPGIIGNETQNIIPQPYTDVPADNQAEQLRKLVLQQRALNIPKEELFANTEGARSERDLARIQAQSEENLKKAKTVEEYRADREAENIGLRRQSAESVARINGMSRINAAALKAKTGAEVDPVAVANDIKTAHDGLATLNELKKLAPSKEHWAAVQAGMNQEGIRPIDEKQKPLADAFTPAFAALNLYDQWIDQRKEAGAFKANAGIAGKGTDAYRRLYNLGSMIAENLGTFQSLMIKTGRGVTDKRIQQVTEAYKPDPAQSVEDSIEKAQKYRKLLKELFKSTFSIQNESQQGAIQERLGGIIPEASATPKTLKPLQPGYVRVKEKATGRSAQVLPGFDTSKFEEVK